MNGIKRPTFIDRMLSSDKRSGFTTNLNGFSPECVLRCVLRVLGRAYDLPQIRHRLGLPLSSGVTGFPVAPMHRACSLDNCSLEWPCAGGWEWGWVLVPIRLLAGGWFTLACCSTGLYCWAGLNRGSTPHADE